MFLPLLFACFRMYLRQTSASSGSNKDIDALFQGSLQLQLSLFFPDCSRYCAALPDPLATVFRSLKGTTQLPSVLVPSRSGDYQEYSLGPSELKVSKIARPSLFLASSKIRLKSTSESSGPSRDSNSSTSTFMLSHSSKYCWILAMTVLSRALPIWSSTSIRHCLSSIDERQLDCGVDGIILWMAEAFLRVSFRSSSLPCDTVQKARFLEREGDCDSTNSQSDSKERSPKHSVTTEERETKNNTHIRHRTHTRPSLRIIIRQAIRLLQSQSSPQKTVAALPILILANKYQKHPQTPSPHTF